MILNNKLFGTYEVDFPLDKDLVILYGHNGSYKSKTLEALNRHLIGEGERTLYFPDDRTFDITDDQLGQVVLFYKMLGGEEDVFAKYGLKLSLMNVDGLQGMPITSGYLQLVNIFCQAALLEEDATVIIDEPERSLSITIQDDYLDDLMKFPHVKRLVVATHAPGIINNRWENCVKARDCVKMGP